MFAAARAHKAIKHSGGRRKGRGKLLELSYYYGPWNRTAGYHHREPSPKFQTGVPLDDEYSGTVPWNSNYMSLGRTYAIQFTLSGLPLMCPVGTRIDVPRNVMSYYFDRTEHTDAWKPINNDNSINYFYNGGSYAQQRWRLYCVAGSTVQQAKYRLCNEHIYYYGRAARSNPYVPGMYATLRSILTNSSDETLRIQLGNRRNRGYSSYGPLPHGHGVFGYGAYSIPGNHGWVWAYVLGWRFDLSNYGLPGKYIELKRTGSY